MKRIGKMYIEDDWTHDRFLFITKYDNGDEDVVALSYGVAKGLGLLEALESVTTVTRKVERSYPGIATEAWQRGEA